MDSMRSVLCLAALVLFAFTSSGNAQTPGPEARKDPTAMLKAISRDMAQVEAILLKARTEDAGEAATAAVKKIEQLLNDARKKEGEVISGIDKLIEEVRKHQQQKKGGQSKPQKSSRSRQNDRPEKDPRYQNQRPKDREEPRRKRDPDPGKKAGRKPPERAQEDAGHKDLDGVWGQLPDKLFRLVTNREQTVFPVEFQDYVEAYFQRLAENRAP